LEEVINNGLAVAKDVRSNHTELRCDL